MRSLVIRFLDSDRVFWLMVLLALLFVTAHALPASLWLVVETVHVPNANLGEPVVLQVDRTIKRHFNGAFTVTIRQLGSTGWIPMCTTPTNAIPYRPDSELPVPTTLRWWTNGHCVPLPKGSYVVETTWAVHTAWWLPDKRVVNRSNVFEVL